MSPSEGDIGRRYLAFRAPALRVLLRPRSPGRGHRALDVRKDVWPREEVHEAGIELRSATGPNPVDGIAEAAGALVRSAVGDRIERIDDADDASLERDLGPAQAAGVTRAVPPLVVSEDAVAEVGVEHRERPEHLGAAARMGGDQAALARAQRRALVDDVEEGGVDLSDVMEERHPFDAAAGVVVEVGGAAEDERVRRHAPNVGAGGGVVGVDGVEQRLERRGGEPLSAADLAADAQHEAGAGGEAGKDG